LQAAHGQNILHRDIKPANLLVRREGAGWRVKVIDFGLALQQKVAQTSQNTSTTRQDKTLLGDSLAGTADFAAPEQIGRRDDRVGPNSDVYGWAKTCCYALFQTTQPLPKHWQGLPPPLAELLARCLEEDPRNRPQGFSEVLQGLQARSVPPPLPPPEAIEIVPEAHLVQVESAPRQARAERARREGLQNLKDEIRNLKEERARNLGFSGWYKRKLGPRNLILQIVLWWFYGFLWIPVWFLVSVAAEQQRVYDELDAKIDRLRDRLDRLREAA
jgi:serine/threonine protein kinase